LPVSSTGVVFVEALAQVLPPVLGFVAGILLRRLRFFAP
jgi:hypothetical protein